MKKLVRDKIPSIYGHGNYRRCKADEKIELLAKKLCEEGLEFLISKDIEELADILEVVEELVNLYGKERVMRVKEEKRKNRGGFTECWVLESKD